MKDLGADQGIVVAVQDPGCDLLAVIGAPVVASEVVAGSAKTLWLVTKDRIFRRAFEKMAILNKCRVDTNQLNDTPGPSGEGAVCYTKRTPDAIGNNSIKAGRYVTIFNVDTGATWQQDDTYPIQVIELTMVKKKASSRFHSYTMAAPKEFAIAHLDSLQILNLQGTVLKSATLDNNILTGPQQEEAMAIENR